MNYYNKLSLAEESWEVEIENISYVPYIERAIWQKDREPYLPEPHEKGCGAVCITATETK